VAAIEGNAIVVEIMRGCLPAAKKAVAPPSARINPRKPARPVHHPWRRSAGRRVGCGGDWRGRDRCLRHCRQADHGSLRVPCTTSGDVPPAGAAAVVETGVAATAAFSNVAKLTANDEAMAPNKK